MIQIVRTAHAVEGKSLCPSFAAKSLGNQNTDMCGGLPTLNPAR